MSHRDKATYHAYRLATRVAGRRSRAEGSPLRVYWCAEHGGYHLTSQAIYHGAPR